MTRGRLDLLGHIAQPVVRVAAQLRPNAGALPPSERSVLDDVAMNRPWNIAVKCGRIGAKLRRRPLVRGTTIVIVNWNTLPVIQDVVAAIRSYSPGETNILVCDNGSNDGSREWLRSRSDVEVLPLPSNAGHGAALDLAMCRVRTDIAVTLDSDAIPLRKGWLDAVVEPVREGSKVLVGTRSSRSFVHPVFLAIDVSTYLERGLSFQIHFEPGANGSNALWGVDAWDTGELLSRSLEPESIALLDGGNSNNELVPGGMVGDVVYHHGAMSRQADGHLSDDAFRAWRVACAELGVALPKQSREH